LDPPTFLHRSMPLSTSCTFTCSGRRDGECSERDAEWDGRVAHVADARCPASREVDTIADLHPCRCGRRQPDRHWLDVFRPTVALCYHSTSGVDPRLARAQSRLQIHCDRPVREQMHRTS